MSRSKKTSRRIKEKIISSIIGMIIITAIISIYITYSRITYKKGSNIKNIKFLNR